MLRSLALLVALLALGTAASLGPGQEPSGQRAEFRHAGHVSQLWPGTHSNPTEAPRDCRGCHDYSQAEPAANRRPADACTRCHVLGSMDFDLAGARVDPSLEASRAFRHFDHGDLDCRVCHADPEVSGGRRTRADEPPIVVPRAGGAFCGTCHSSGAEGIERFDAALSAALNATAAARPAGAEADPRPFRHADHLRPEDLASAAAASCQPCHADIARADALHLSEHQLRLDGCGECHLGRSFELELHSKPSLTAATFVHAYHLGADRGRAGLEEAADRLRREGCAVCHAFSPEAQTFAVRDLLAEQGQAGCVECHTDWSVPNHGRSDACSHCHALQEGGLTSLASQGANRPRTLVRRASPDTFAIQVHAHPFVHGAAGAEEDCARCHVATLERAPSRIGTKPFRHDVHLPQDVSGLASEACTACHGSIAQAVSIDGVVGTRHGPPGSGVSFNFDRQSCDRCHGAAAFQPVVPDPVQPREALAFDHRAHLAKRHPLASGRNMTCVDCHALEATQGDWRIVSDAKVASCTLCHGHDEAKAPITAGLDRRAIDACTHCHAPGVPRRGEAVAVERARLGAARGDAVHSSAQACSVCHQMPAEGREPAPRAEVAARLFAAWEDTNSPHRFATLSGSTQPYFQDRVACIDCHWGNLDRPRLQILGQFRRQRQSPLERVREAAPLEQESAFRAHFGRDLEGFPGLDSR